MSMAVSYVINKDASLRLFTLFPELPFFYHNSSRHFFRIEAVPYIYHYNARYNSYELYFFLNTKARYRMLLPVMWRYRDKYNPMNITNTFEYKFLHSNSYVNFIQSSKYHFGHFGVGNDYFPVDQTETLASSLLNLSTFLSDLAVSASRLCHGALRRFDEDSKDFDIYISTFNSL